jgi:hypothetical protein
MGNIETTYDLSKDLTIAAATGKMKAADFSEWTAEYYKGTVTRNVLWNIEKADMSELRTEDLRNDAKHTKDLAEVRNGGKTAIVTGSSLEYGMSRMLEAFYGIEDVPFEVQVFRNLDDAVEWLGV